LYHRYSSIERDVHGGLQHPCSLKLCDVNSGLPDPSSLIRLVQVFVVVDVDQTVSMYYPCLYGLLKVSAFPAFLVSAVLLHSFVYTPMYRKNQSSRPRRGVQYMPSDAKI
jgi:hypothetical protein